MTNAQISERLIIAIAANGGDVAAGYDAVFGAGAYLALAGEVYDALRAQASA